VPNAARSPLACLRALLHQEGLRGLTRGFVPTLCREIPGNAIFFTVYETLRRAWPGRQNGVHSSSSSSSSEFNTGGGGGGH
jgi:Mitochondrial carrier protein